MLQNVAANRRMSSIADRTTRTRRPRLPVPNLRQTLDKYLLSVTPLLQEDARKGGEPFSEAYSRRKVWADEFEVGIGKEVQERLIGQSFRIPVTIPSDKASDSTGPGLPEQLAGGQFLAA